MHNHHTRKLRVIHVVVHMKINYFQSNLYKNIVLSCLDKILEKGVRSKMRVSLLCKMILVKRKTNSKESQNFNDVSSDLLAKRQVKER